MEQSSCITANGTGDPVLNPEKLIEAGCGEVIGMWHVQRRFALERGAIRLVLLLAKDTSAAKQALV
jgi:hypothetical protein